MTRKFSSRPRNTKSRVPRPVILIVAEGRNVTETQYFKQFQKQHAVYSIKLITPGSVTDPKKMLEKLQYFWERNEMDTLKGDLGFVVLDLDCDDRKGKVIEKLAKASKIARFIVSNPCFEVWFLLHYKYTTHVYLNSEEVIRDLRNYISDYEKNMDVFGKLSDKTEIALQNALKLERHFDELGYKWPSNEGNPRTDVSHIIERVKELGGDVL